MALDGAKMARLAQKFVTFAQGQTPVQLVPAVGDPLSCVHDKRELFTEATDSGIVRGERLEVMASTGVGLATIWTYDGHEWLVEGCEPDKMGGVAWPYRIRLVRHA